MCGRGTKLLDYSDAIYSYGTKLTRRKVRFGSRTHDLPLSPAGVSHLSYAGACVNRHGISLIYLLSIVPYFRLLPYCFTSTNLRWWLPFLEHTGGVASRTCHSATLVPTWGDGSGTDTGGTFTLPDRPLQMLLREMVALCLSFLFELEGTLDPPLDLSLIHI